MIKFISWFKIKTDNNRHAASLKKFYFLSSLIHLLDQSTKILGAFAKGPTLACKRYSDVFKKSLFLCIFYESHGRWKWPEILQLVSLGVVCVPAWMDKVCDLFGQ
jgi:hypothetical protein